MAYFLGERYVPGADQGAAMEPAERLRMAVQLSPYDGLRLLSTTFVANEEWVFDLFEAESAEQVEHAYEAGGIAFERITEAVHVIG